MKMPINRYLKEFISSPKGTLAIVPNKRWTRELNRLLSRNGAVLGQRVYTPRDILLERSSHIHPIVPKGLRKHIIRACFSSIERGYFKNVSSGTVSSMASAIAELKRNRILPEELEAILSTRGGPKEADLLKTYHKYNAELASRDWHDEEDLWNIEPFKESDIWLIGFGEETPWMKALFPNARFCRNDVPTALSSRVSVLNSPLAEARHVAKALMDNKESTVYLNNLDPFAWMIQNDLKSILPARPWANRTLQELLSGADISGSNDVNGFISLILNRYSRPKVDIKAHPEASAKALSESEMFIELLRRISFEWKEFNGPFKISKEEFIAMIRDELSEDNAWPCDPPFRLASFAEAGLYDDDLAVIPIMNDGYMPPKGSEAGFFMEPDTLSPFPDERIAEIFPVQERLNERALNSLKMAMGRETLITYHAHSTDGSDTAPSPFIVRLERKRMVAAGTISVKTNIPRETILKEPSAKEFLSKQLIKHIFSPSQLEEFGRCPFAYFCRYILGLAAPEEVTPEVQPKDRGTLIHAILEEFFKRHGNAFMSMDIASSVPKIVEEMFDKNNDITSKYNAEMVRHLKQRSVRLITAVLEDERETLSKIEQRPAYFEHEFKDIFVDDIVIKGKIDRIDMDDETFTVIDYKTGNIDPVRSGIEKGTEFQMPIYSEMAGRLLKGKKAAAAFLYSTKKKRRDNGMVNKELKDHVFGKDRARLAIKAEEWDALIETSKERAREYVNDIKCGCFRMNEDGCGKFCDWKDACGIH